MTEKSHPKLNYALGCNDPEYTCFKKPWPVHWICRRKQRT